MFRYDCYRCPQCGEKHDDSGRLGTSKQCDCGNWLSQSQLDRVRHYWIAQIALCFAIASFFISFALFNHELPTNPQERFFSPILQVPAFASFVVSYRMLVRHKRMRDGDGLLLRRYFLAICLMSIGMIVSLLEGLQK